MRYLWRKVCGLEQADGLSSSNIASLLTNLFLIRCICFKSLLTKQSNKVRLRPYTKIKSTSKKNHIHIQRHMQIVRQCQAHTKPGGSDIASKRKKTLAKQKLEEKWKWCITRNGSTTTTTKRQRKEGGHMCGLTMKLSYF